MKRLIKWFFSQIKKRAVALKRLLQKIFIEIIAGLLATYLLYLFKFV